jgi:hypothetical protein
MGLGQTWNMFSSPWTEHRYARLRYYVASPQSSKAQGATPTRMATEMVFPILRVDERMHLLRAYRAFAWDKAFISAIQESVRERPTSGLPSALAPVIRFFANRFKRQHLVSGEHLVRVEVWLGRSPLRQRGSSPKRLPDGAGLSLTHASAGSVEEAVSPTDYPPLNAIEIQEDIVWRLEYLDERFE